MLPFFVSFEYLAGLGGLAVTSAVLDTSDVIDFFDQEKSSFISELIEGNEEISINLLNILMEQQLLCPMCHYRFVCPQLFMTYTQIIIHPIIPRIIFQFASLNTSSL